MTATYDYDAFGNIKSQSGQTSHDLKYTGEQNDPESGLVFLRARYYDPTVGRFISKDTYKGETGNPLSQNQYIYVENNPIKYIDPSGHCFCDACVIESTAIIETGIFITNLFIVVKTHCFMDSDGHSSSVKGKGIEALLKKN